MYKFMKRDQIQCATSKTVGTSVGNRIKALLSNSANNPEFEFIPISEDELPIVHTPKELADGILSAVIKFSLLHRGGCN